MPASVESITFTPPSIRFLMLIRELAPRVNVQVGPPDLPARAIPRALQRDVIVFVPSIEADSVELIAARVDGAVMIQRTRRSGADLAVHTRRLLRFFRSPLRRGLEDAPLAPIVFSWLAGRGADATRIDPSDVSGPRELQRRIDALFRDERLFHERFEQC